MYILLSLRILKKVLSYRRTWMKEISEFYFVFLLFNDYSNFTVPFTDEFLAAGNVANLKINQSVYDVTN